MRQYKEAPEIERRDNEGIRVSYFLGQTLDEPILLTGASKDSILVRVETTGYVPVVGNALLINNGKLITQDYIVGVTPVSGNIYDLDIMFPLERNYDDNTYCIIQNLNMAVDGSTTPIEFSLGTRGEQIIDITRMMVAMTLNGQPDDGLFGDRAELSYQEAQCFRKVSNASDDNNGNQQLFSVLTNGYFVLEGFDVRYTQRSGGQGNYGMHARITFNGDDKSGVVEKLRGEFNDRICTVVRADLSTFVQYGIKVQGHFADSNYVDSYWND